MPWFRRHATAQQFASTIQAILDRHARAFVDEYDSNSTGRVIALQMYNRSKALAKDLNAAVHLQYETYTNLFGVDIFGAYKNAAAPYVLLGKDREVDLEDYAGRRAGRELVRLIDKTLARDVVDDPALEFLRTLVQYSTDWGFQAHAHKDETVKVEVGGAFVEIQYAHPDVVYLAILGSYGIKTGAGSKILRVVTELADIFCVEITGVANVIPLEHMDPKVERRPTYMPQQKLYDFYRHFGFVVHPDKSMEREPNCQIN